MTSLPKSNEPGKLKSRMKWLIYIVLIAFFALLQSVAALPRIFDALPLLVLPAVVCISMFEGPIGGAFAGIIGGFLWDLFDFRLFGFNALILLAICCLCGLISQLYIRNNLFSSIIMIVAALLIQSLLDWFFNFVLVSDPAIFYILKNIFLPRILYTVAVSPFVFGMMFFIAKVFRKKEF